MDRQGLIDSLLGGAQLPALTFTPPGVYGHVEEPEEVGIPYSPMLASELLASAGYTNGVGLPAVTLWVNPGHQSIGEYVAGNWRSNLGVTVTVNSSLGWGTPYFSKLDGGTAVLTHTVEMPESAPAPGDYLMGTDHVFGITAVDAESGAPLGPTGAYTMTVAYSDQEISAAGIEDEGMLGLFYWNGEAWVEEPTSQVDTEANIVTATPDHFSLWAVMREPFLARLPLSLRP